MKGSRADLLGPEDLQGVDDLALIAQRIVEGARVGLHRSHLHGFSMEFAEYREYVPGDDLRYFDWRALGRSDRRYIKKFHSETNLRCELVLDGSGSMGYGKPLTKLRYGACLAASLAHVLARQQDEFGLTIVDDRVRQRIPPAGGQAHLRLLFDALARTEPGASTALAGTLDALAGSMPRRGMVIILSDLHDDEGAFLDAIKHFRFAGHEVIVLHLLDPSEIHFDFDRLHEFVDLETGRRLDVHGPTFREAYRARIRQWLEDLQSRLDACGVDRVLIETSRPFPLVLAEFLHRRRVRRAGR